MRDPDLSFLFRTGWLADASEDLRDAIQSRSSLRTVTEGETLYHVGDAPGGLYGVAQGLVSIHGGQHGDEQTLFHVVGPGFWTGEYATITGQPRLVSLTARTTVQVVRLTRADFLRIADAYPLAWRHVALMASRNVERALAINGAMRRDKPTERLALTLKNIALELPGPPTVLRVSQEDLAAMICMSRGSVNAALARLEGAGLLRRDYGTITLHDVAGLAAFQDAT